MPTALRRLSVFCGSNVGARAEYAAAARALGQLLAREGIGLVYGGGNVGLMGVLADGALSERGEVIGVIPRRLQARELGHTGVTELRVVESMHERKAMMADLSDGFVALPGGLGTLEELFEVATWGQLGIHRKPVGLLDVAGYYSGLRQFLSHAVQERFLKGEHASLLLVREEPAAMLAALRAFEPGYEEKWLDRAQR